MNKPKFGVSQLVQNLMRALPQKQAPAVQHNEDTPSIQIQSKPGAVRFLFSRPAAWVAFTADDARGIAAALLAHANLADGLNEDGSPKIITPPGIILPS